MSSLASSEVAKKQLRWLWIAQLATWVLSFLLIYLASFLPLFDSSPQVIFNDASSNSSLLARTLPLLRWDVFHYGHIALRGYVYEYEWAFLPGVPFLMSMSSRLLNFVFSRNASSPSTWATLLQGGLLATCFTQSSSTLYHLTLHHTASPSAAFLTALLSLLPSSPATLQLVANSEPFFTFFSYKGMLYCARSRWFLASLSFALASTFRSNGFILGGFILWGLLIDPVLNHKPVSPIQFLRATFFTAIIFLPFITYQYVAYITFCSGNTPPAPWCSNFPPTIYTYVQSKYWNVGFLRYWTLSQLPNFLMSAPVLVILFWFSSHHIRHTLIPSLLTFNSKPPSSPTTKDPTNPFLSPSLTPHAIHAFILTSTLLFSAHTQIVLRLAASMPLTYWAAAYLLIRNPSWGRWWVGWSVVWGAVSLVLWTTFLPPA